MGIQLGPLLETRQIKVEELSGQRVAIDGYNVLYQFLTSIRQADGSLLTDSKGRVTSHLSGIFFRFSKLVENGIKLCIVFDGKPPALKKNLLEERRQRKIKAQIEWEAAIEAGDRETARTKAQQTTRLDSNMVSEAKKLLDLNCYISISGIITFSKSAELANLFISSGHNIDIYDPIAKKHDDENISQFAFAKNTFELDGAGRVIYDAVQSNGKPLPRWITFLPSQRMFLINKSEKDNTEELNIKVSARNINVRTEDNFNLLVDLSSAIFDLVSLIVLINRALSSSKFIDFKISRMASAPIPAVNDSSPY